MLTTEMRDGGITIHMKSRILKLYYGYNVNPLEEGIQADFKLDTEHRTNNDIGFSSRFVKPNPSFRSSKT